MLPPGAAPPPPRWPTVLLSIATAAVGLWIAATTFLLQGVAWLVAEVLAGLGLPAPSWSWAVVAWVNAVTVALPAGALALFARRFTPDLPGVRTAAATWIAGGVAAGVLGTARAVPVPHNEVLLCLTAILAAAAAVGVRRVGAGLRGPVAASSPPATRPPATGSRRHVVGFGLAGGLIALLPWLWAGSLGGLTETVLAVAAAGAIGWLAANLLHGFFAGYTRSRAWQVAVGGCAAGIALVPVGAAVGATGVNVAEMLMLPALGFAAAALAASTWPAPAGRLPVVCLVGVAAAGPLAFVDPEETTLLLGVADVGRWTLLASALGVGAALVAGTTYGLTLRPRALVTPWLSATVALVVAIAGIGVYGLAGRPGLYGERLFVVLADQADLAGLDAIADRPERLRATYRRLVDHAERTQGPLRETLARWGLNYRPYYLVNAVLVDGGPIVRQWLAARSDVDRVLLDQRVRPLPVAVPTTRGTSAAPDGSPQWNIRAIQADRAWRDLDATGRGIVIGSSDSGVDGGHPALRDGFRGGDDSWYDPWNATATPTDHGGHGTHTLGSALGRTGIGVAPDAQWVGCVNLDRNLGSPSLYLDCPQFMLAPFPRGGDPLREGRPQRAPHVLTNSWGCPEIEGCDLGALRPATAALRAAGIFVVAGAGNTGPRCGSVEDPPAPYPDVFTVGAVDRAGRVTDFSSRGPTPDGLPKPDIVAPGADVLSALPDGTYGSYDGTSMATPHVAGVVALMWSANPRLVADIDTTARILRDTAAPATPSDQPNDPADACGTTGNVAGAGLVDAYAAVRAARDAS